MKGIVLAGGSGTRLYPMTRAISKQLLPIYDKPMIYYPLSTLMEADIREILLISTPRDLPLFERLLGDGSDFGIAITYAEQVQPEGIAQALIIAEQFLNQTPCTLILGDNLFFGHGLHIPQTVEGALIFTHEVSNPERFGVVRYNDSHQVIDIVEKPQNPPSSHAVCGLYCYDAQAPYWAKTLRPSLRGELEITDLNRLYLDQSCLHHQHLARGFTWLDTGTQEDWHAAGNWVATLENRQGWKIACLEEIAYRKGWIDQNTLKKHIVALKNSAYGRYLEHLLEKR